MQYPELTQHPHFMEPYEVNLLSRSNINVPVKTTIEYLNGLGRPVTLSYRNGLRLSVKPDHSLGKRAIEIRSVVTLDDAGKVAAISLLRNVDESDTKELQAMRDQLNTGHARKHGPVSVSSYFRITEEELLKAPGKSIYIPDLDIVLSLEEEPIFAPHHPYSQGGRFQELAKLTSIDLNAPNFGMCIEFIDNKGIYGSKYYNHCKSVYLIDPKKDLTKKDGIYVHISLKSDELKAGKRGTTYTYYELSDETFKSLLLFSTHEDALNNGDIETNQKKELAELEHQINLSRLDLTARKAEIDREMAELDRLKDKRAAEAKEREAELERRSKELDDARARFEHQQALEKTRVKDHYEALSIERKDSSEVLKWLPIAIAGIGAAIVAAKALFFSGTAKLMVSCVTSVIGGFFSLFS
jgi:hypothetical protein